MALNTGDKAPDFTTKTHNMDDFNLDAVIGKSNIVLLFFPLVNTKVCHNELCVLRDTHKDYEELNAQVYAISVDSPFAQKLWVEKENYNFTMLTDFNKEISAKYGCQYNSLAGLKGVAKRSAFIIDKEGILRYIWISDDAGVLPNFEEIKSTLEKIG